MCALGKIKNVRGGIAQLGERLNGIQEVSGSIPLISTKFVCIIAVDILADFVRRIITRCVNKSGGFSKRMKLRANVMLCVSHRAFIFAYEDNGNAQYCHR